MIKHWTEKEIKYLRDNYETMKTKDMSEVLSRTIISVCRKAEKLNIKKIKKPREKIQFIKEQYEFFDGIVGSDTHISKAGCFSGSFKYKEFAEYIIKSLSLTCEIKKYEGKDNRVKSGKTISYDFKKTSDLFKQEHQRWYYWGYCRSGCGE